MNDTYQFDPAGAFRAEREEPNNLQTVEVEADVESDDGFS